MLNPERVLRTKARLTAAAVWSVVWKPKTRTVKRVVRTGTGARGELLRLRNTSSTGRVSLAGL